MTQIKDPNISWVLMAVVYGGGAKRANLDSIISAADYVNHAVISYEEISDGLAFLLKKGIITRIGLFYKLSTKIAARYQSLKTNRISVVWKLSEEIIEEYRDTPNGESKASIKPVTKPDYDSAVHDYLERNKPQD